MQALRRSVAGLLALASGCGAATPADGGSTDEDAGPCDADGDGHASRACGGHDCNDDDPGVSPSSDEDEGGTWLIETVAPLGVWPDLAVGRAGSVHLVFVGTTLEYARREHGGWTVTDIGEQVAPFPRIAVTVDGSVHALWVANDGASDSLRHGTDADEDGAFEVDGWEVADGVGRIGLTVDGVGDVHAVYASGRNFHHAVRGEDGWQDELVFTTEAALLWSPIVTLDSAEHLHFAVIESPWFVDECGSFPTATYGTNASGAWTMESIGSDLAAGVSLSLTPDGTPVAALTGSALDYSSCAPGRGLRFGRRDASGWALEAQEPEAEVFAAALARDADSVHLAFSALEVAYQDDTGAPWAPELVDAVSADAIRMVVQGGNVHIVYSPAWGPKGNGGIKYARRSVRDGIDNDCDGEAW